MVLLQAGSKTVLVGAGDAGERSSKPEPIGASRAGTNLEVRMSGQLDSMMECIRESPACVNAD